MTKQIQPYSPYCPDCESCGETGCCSPLMCKQTPTGKFCKTNLAELKFGYHMYQFVQKLLEHLPQEQQDRFDRGWDEAYDYYIK